MILTYNQLACVNLINIFGCVPRLLIKWNSFIWVCSAINVNWNISLKMSFSSEPSSKQTSSLPRQDTATTISSFSTSLSNLDTAESSLSNSSSLRRQKPKQNKHKKRKKSVEHFVPFGDEKTLRTLKVHYYPEGHWGFVVILVAVLVQTFNHGLQLAYGVFLVQLLHVFGPTMYTGKLIKL